MHYSKFQPATLPALINTILNDSISREFDTVWNGPAHRHIPLTNVSESTNAFHIDLVTPGFNKEDLTVNVDKNVLVIEGKHETAEENKEHKNLRKEYHLKSFKRQFTLPDNADDSHIKAEYVNGILKVTLPKKADAQVVTKQVTIQ